MDQYIDGLMSRMTLEQKIGQLNLHSAPGCEPGDFEIMMGPNSRDIKGTVLTVL